MSEIAVLIRILSIGVVGLAAAIIADAMFWR